MARTVTVEFATTTAAVPGIFTPSGYRVAIGNQQQIVQTSPAVFTSFGNMQPGEHPVTVVLLDELGNDRGDPLVGSFTLPSDATMANVPVSMAVVVSVS